MKIVELYETSYPYEWTKRRSDQWEARFTAIDDSVITTEIHDFEDYWEILFLRNGSAAETKQGDTLKIFATIIKQVQEFVNQINPQCIVFTAGKTEDADGKDTRLSRIQLYRRIVRRFASDYSVREQELPRDKVKFTLTRRDQ